MCAQTCQIGGQPTNELGVQAYHPTQRTTLLGTLLGAATGGSWSPAFQSYAVPPVFLWIWLPCALPSVYNNMMTTIC